MNGNWKPLIWSPIELSLVTERANTPTTDEVKSGIAISITLCLSTPLSVPWRLIYKGIKTTEIFMWWRELEKIILLIHPLDWKEKIKTKGRICHFAKDKSNTDWKYPIVEWTKYLTIKCRLGCVDKIQININLSNTWLNWKKWTICAHALSSTMEEPNKRRSYGNN